MADDLKFGPKWLHALTDGNSVTSPPPSPGFVPKYKLADHRYGREEMLALFPHKSSIPDELKSFPILCLDKVQHPLAFAPLSEEEQQLLTPGVNSLAVLRMMGRGASVPRGGGRGGGDRGRGRGRGRGDGFYSSREYEDGGFGRGRTLRADSWDDRGGDKRFGGFSRGFPEENVISPRKEFSRSMSSDNWREQPKQEQEQEDDGNWRRAGPKDKNLGTRVSWRERGSDKDYERPRFDERPYDRGGYGNRNRYKSTGSQDGEEDLPEWSMADTEDDIGTFDASGAFMSVKELEEKKHKVKDGGEPVSKKKELSSTEPGDHSDKKLKKVKGSSPESDARREEVVPEKPKVSKTVPKSNINKQDTQKEAAAASTNKVSGPPAGGGLVTPKSQGKPPPEGTVTRATKGKPGREDTRGSASSVVDTKSVISQEVASSKAPPGKKDKVQSSATKPQTAREKQPPKDQKKRSPVPPLKADSETKVIKVERPQVEDVPKTAINNTARTKGREPPPVTTRKQEEEADFGHLEKAAENLVAEMTLEEEEDAVMEEDFKRRENDLLTVGKPMALAMDHEHAQKWFYRDPQGEVQGPFGAGEMSEWFSAGYFTMNLMVKRGCDENFHTLGDLIKKWGRVPFLPGNVPPPLRVSPVTIPSTQAPPTVSSNVSVSSAAPPPQVATTTADSQLAAAQQAEQLKAFLFQQQYIQQQAVVFRQLQMQQFIQSLQQNEAWTKLPAQQQQQLALQLMLKQQQQQQQQTAVLQHSLGNAATTASSTVVTQGEGQPTPAMLGAVVSQQQMVVSSQQQSQQQDLTAATQQLHNTPKQLQGMPEKRNDPSASIWNALNKPPVSGSAWSQPASVWDIEQSGKAKSLEEIEREDFTRAQQEKEKRDLEVRQKKENEERVRQQREVERLRQMEIQKEMERQREVDKQREREKTREMERHAELEKQRMEQLQREEAEKRRQEEEQLRRAEEQLRRAEEQRRQVEEEKQKEMEAEKKRGEEMRRRQQKAEELRRQQQKEALFRLQQEQLANMQLPQHVQWASNNTGVSQNPTGLTLQQIQQLEAQQERQEMVEREKLEQQRQQLEALKQQQDKASLSWAQRSQQAAALQAQPMKSLLEIQQEQARQHLSDLKNKQSKQTTVPLATAAAWSGSGVNPANWAQEGAWGNNRNVTGFWEEPVQPKPTPAPTEKVNNAHFPALHQQPTVNSHAQNKQKQHAKTKKEEETVQRLFQVVNPKDDFTQWCEKALSGMQSSVDIPTFVGFLIEVESPYEVHDYVRSYLGDSKDSIDFAKQFIEKRSHSRSQTKNQTQQKEEAMWGPAPAVNPNRLEPAMTNNNFELVTNGKGNNQKKKTKKMQRVDNSILGFTCSAATERVNIGEIENL